MVSFSTLTLAASVAIGMASALPTDLTTRQDAWAPGVNNNTREFYLSLWVTDGPTTYNGWTRKYLALSPTKFDAEFSS